MNCWSGQLTSTELLEIAQFIHMGGQKALSRLLLLIMKGEEAAREEKEGGGGGGAELHLDWDRSF